MAAPAQEFQRCLWTSNPEVLVDQRGVIMHPWMTGDGKSSIDHFLLYRETPGFRLESSSCIAKTVLLGAMVANASGVRKMFRNLRGRTAFSLARVTREQDYSNKVFSLLEFCCLSISPCYHG